LISPVERRFDDAGDGNSGTQSNAQRFEVSTVDKSTWVDVLSSADPGRTVELRCSALCVSSGDWSP
jgi:hypothetical protein